MNITPFQSINFSGYIPVKYYAYDEKMNKIRPIQTKKYIRKCNSFVVRNLNGTAKKTKSTGFVDFYKKQDQDYAKCPKVRSVYDKKLPIVHLFTGEDVNKIDEMAIPVGIAKGNSMDAFNHSHSFEAVEEAKDFYKKAISYAKSCKRVKSDTGRNCTLSVLFKPKYTKNDKVKGFDFLRAEILTDKRTK